MNYETYLLILMTITIIELIVKIYIDLPQKK